MKTLILLTALTLPFLALAEEPELKPIFNSKDFSGWTMSLEDKFSIEDRPGLHPGQGLSRPGRC